MRRARYSPAVLAVASMAFAACNDSLTARPQLATDAIITADIAASAGEAISSAVDNMLLNEGGGVALAVVGADGSANEVSRNLEYVRSRTCFDQAGAIVANCSPIASVRKIVVHVTATGTRGRTGDAGASWTGTVHRVADDTTVRVFTGAQQPVETSRIHSGVAVAHDTTSFGDGAMTRQVAETANDTVKTLTWNLPRSSNPWPVSGQIVRGVTVHMVATNGTRTETRDVKRTVSVTFPADAQGNVVLTVNDRTCSLNLVTRVVSNCQ